MQKFFKPRVLLTIFGLMVLAGCSKSEDVASNQEIQPRSEASEFGTATFDSATWK